MISIVKRLINLPYGLRVIGKSSMVRKTVLALFAIALVGACCFGLLTGVKHGYQFVQAKIIHTLDWRIQNIEVRQAMASPVDITEIMDQNGLNEGVYIHDVKWPALIDDLNRNPMVENAIIQRPTAEKVVITLMPSKIVARVSESNWTNIDSELRQRQAVLIDKAGQKIRVTPRTQDKALIGVSGKKVLSSIDSFWPLLMAEPNISQLTRAVEFIGQRRWDITLKNGTLVKLPEQETGLALRRLAKMIDQKAINIDTVQAIDLRTNDRAFVEYKKEDQGVSDAAQS